MTRIEKILAPTVLMGSVTEQIVRNVVCPVFSVHQPRAAPKSV